MKNKVKCHFKECGCKKEASIGFVSEKGNLQRAKYCKEHATEVKKRGAFPQCKQTYLMHWDKIEGFWKPK